MACWDYHEHPRPGVLYYTLLIMEIKIWTVRAGTQRILDVFTLRTLCDIGDEFADGYVRFTIRSNIEYMISDEAKVQPLIDKLRVRGLCCWGNQKLGCHDFPHSRLVTL